MLCAIVRVILPTCQAQHDRALSAARIQQARKARVRLVPLRAGWAFSLWLAARAPAKDRCKRGEGRRNSSVIQRAYRRDAFAENRSAMILPPYGDNSLVNTPCPIIIGKNWKRRSQLSTAGCGLKK
jgi:hypothetical protein